VNQTRKDAYINILLVNDDGPTAVGLSVLAYAIRQVYKGARLVTITPTSSLGEQSMAVTCADLHTFDIKKTEEDCYTVDAKPADLIYLAGAYCKRFLSRGRFHVVFSGVNHGANVGMDVYHSGTVGMAMVAAVYLGTGAVAFSKHMNWPHLSDESALEQVAEIERYLCEILESLRPMPGQCLNVNFPICVPRGVKHCAVARCSRFRPFLEMSEKKPGQDIWELEQGYVTISRLR